MKKLEKDCRIEIPYRYDLSFKELHCLYKDSEDIFAEQVLQEGKDVKKEYRKKI